ncbi:MAG: hypothetical protein H6830_08530 [Planctomycetes bacterium]|nr:hypothetical protein [Planctomycetota bacterium]MCB9909680.1 hypothetical protein [Planctomycetota bacterium]MCB9911831.1 hypothetical protein [Planctomycetota bacterium]HPF14308.1 hypothetical protein [Planctomycetota bacterium]
MPLSATQNRGATTVQPGVLRRAKDREPNRTDTAALYLFAALEATEIRFALLRGYDAGSAQRPGSDVDLVVHPEDHATFQECLEVACEHSGTSIVQTHRTPYAEQFLLHGRTQAGSHSLLSLDVHTAETCYGMPYLEAERLLDHCRPKPAARFRWEQSGQAPMVPCVDGAWAGLVRFQNGFLSAGEVRTEGLLWFAKASAADQQSIERELHRAYGAQMGQRLVWALRERDVPRLEKLARSARRKLWWRCWRRAALPRSADTLRTLYALRVRPYFQPRGLCIAFLGTDGSGKTTLIEALRGVLQPHYRDGQSGVRKLRPGLLPQINRWFHPRKLRYSVEDCSRPHRAQPSGALGSAFRASYYALDCLLGWPLRILPLRRRNALLIFDRYYLEFLVDPRRARIAPKSPVPRWWSRVVPQPDTMLVCVADPKVIHKRKQELPYAEIERQVQGFETLPQKFPRTHLIRTEGSLEDSLDHVLSAIYAPSAP